MIGVFYEESTHILCIMYNISFYSVKIIKKNKIIIFYNLVYNVTKYYYMTYNKRPRRILNHSVKELLEEFRVNWKSA